MTPHLTRESGVIYQCPTSALLIHMPSHNDSKRLKLLDTHDALPLSDSLLIHIDLATRDLNLSLSLHLLVPNIPIRNNRTVPIEHTLRHGARIHQPLHQHRSISGIAISPQFPLPPLLLNFLTLRKPLLDRLDHLPEPVEVQRIQHDVAAQVHGCQPRGHKHLACIPHRLVALSQRLKASFMDGGSGLRGERGGVM